MNENYQLYHGDCLEIMPQLLEDGFKVDLILTDPPYGTTTHNWDSTIPLDEMWDCIKSLRYESTPIVLFGSEPFSSNLRMSNIKEYKYDWVWEKDQMGAFGIAKYQPLRYHELISVFYKTHGGKYYPQMIPRKSPRVKQAQKTGYSRMSGHREGIFGGAKPKNIPFTNYDADYKYPSSVLHFNKVNSNSHEKVPHPTQKPVKLLEYLIKTYTNENDIVLDFTMGSGSTGVACMNLNRKFIGIELEEKYYNIAQQRLQEATRSKQTTLI